MDEIIQITWRTQIDPYVGCFLSIHSNLRHTVHITSSELSDNIWMDLDGDRGAPVMATVWPEIGELEFEYFKDIIWRLNEAGFYMTTSFDWNKEHVFITMQKWPIAE